MPHNKIQRGARAMRHHYTAAIAAVVRCYAELRNRFVLICALARSAGYRYLENYRDYVVADVPLPQQLLPVIRRER